MDREIKVKCTLFLGNVKSERFEEHATTETVVERRSMDNLEEQDVCLLMGYTKSVTDLIGDPRQMLYHSDDDSIEIAVLLRLSHT